MKVQRSHSIAHDTQHAQHTRSAARVPTVLSTLVTFVAVCAAAFSFHASAADPNAFTCSAEDRVLADSIRPGSVAQCPAGTATSKPAYELVCQDSGLKFGCCRSACDCKFTAQAFGNKGWGSGGRAYKTYQIGGACPRPPAAPYPKTGTPEVLR